MIDLSRQLTDLRIQPEDVAQYTVGEIRRCMERVGYNPNYNNLVLFTAPANHPKARKAMAGGYHEFILHLHADRVTVDVAPDGLGPIWQEVQTCPHATRGEGGCVSPCLMYSGRGKPRKDGATTVVQAGRAKRTNWLHQDPHSFVAQLVREMNALYRWAMREGYSPVFRLNGTSDIRWERALPWLFEFQDPTVTSFLDYTKWPPGSREVPGNYYLAYSVQHNKDGIEGALDAIETMPVSMITDDPKLLLEELPHLFVDADSSDTWIMTSHGLPHIGVLRPKVPLTKTHPTVYPARDIIKYMEAYK